MGWYATRSIYHFGTKENGINIFEERIVCFEASDFDEANVKAVNQSKEYARDNGFEVHGIGMVPQRVECLGLASVDRLTDCQRV